jgi:hypothetical protein
MGNVLYLALVALVLLAAAIGIVSLLGSVRLSWRRRTRNGRSR